MPVSKCCDYKREPTLNLDLTHPQFYSGLVHFSSCTRRGARPQDKWLMFFSFRHSKFSSTQSAAVVGLIGSLAFTKLTIICEPEKMHSYSAFLSECIAVRDIMGLE